MNAPEAGTLKEFLVKEEDTVTVGQDLLKMETGGEVKGIKKAGGQTPKSPGTEDQPTSSHPEPSKKNENGSHDEKPQPAAAPAPPSQTQKKSSSTGIDPHEQTDVNAKMPTISDSKNPGAHIPYGSREERRVFSH